MSEITPRRLWEQISAYSIRVDLSFPPTLPFKQAQIAWRWGKQEGDVVLEKRRDGLYVGNEKAGLYLYSQGHEFGGISGKVLKQHLVSMPVLHPNVMDAAIETGLLPEEWTARARGTDRIQRILFWGLGFSDPRTNNEYVRYVSYEREKWLPGVSNLCLPHTVSRPAAVIEKRSAFRAFFGF